MIFRRAILGLTLTYTVVQLILFAAFALGIYVFVTGTFDFDAAESGGQAINAAERGFAALRAGLLVCYAALLVIVPFSSYLMARVALAPIRASYELQQGFVDSASHELRTPLAVIQGELELALGRSRSAAQYRSAIGKALEATDGLIRLSNDLLLLTRDPAGELASGFARLDLNEVIAGVVSSADAATRNRVVLELAPVVPVLGSGELLARALANLLDNAHKFSAPGSIIAISSSSSGGTATVTVADEGVGMTTDEAGRAFDRFWRAQSSRSTPGHGLGLSLVRQICEAHYGKVTISSHPGKGTVTTISLPLSA
jgi:signal transduction histidine kinase